MLLMAALEFCDPVTLVVLVKTRDASVHECILIARLGWATAPQPHPRASPGGETLLRRLLEPPQRIDRPEPELAAQDHAQQRSAPP